jgi:hypothetical protein
MKQFVGIVFAAAIVMAALCVESDMLVSERALAASYKDAGKSSERKSTIIFDHVAHTELGVECDQCHASAAESESGTTNDLPTMDVCADCHDVEDETQCGMCHMDADAPVPSPRIALIPEFSHEWHLQEVEDCLVCHPGIIDTGVSTMPGHDQCFSCHDGAVADNSCLVCHEGGAEKPADHGLAYTHTHRYNTVIDPDRCESCHASSDFCSECHLGENVLPQTHERDFLFTHPMDLQSRMYECTACHNIESFCAECHMDLGVVPPEHGCAEWVTGRNIHGLRARQNIEACASCHQEGDPGWCSTCHSDIDGIRGTDTDIHPAGFGAVSGYGPWMDDPGYYCFDCHVDTRDQPAAGFCVYCHDPK